MANVYSIGEFSENKNYNDDDVFIIDDRPTKFNEKTGKFVKPGELGYDELPDLVR